MPHVSAVFVGGVSGAGLSRHAAPQQQHGGGRGHLPRPQPPGHTGGPHPPANPTAQPPHAPGPAGPAGPGGHASRARLRPKPHEVCVLTFHIITQAR